MEADLDLLDQLPRLEYVSIGGPAADSFASLTQGTVQAARCGSFNAATLVLRLCALPALLRIWLDGIAVTEDQLQVLQQHFDHVKITTDG